MSERDYILRAQAALGVDDHLLQLGSIRFTPVGVTSREQAAAAEPTEASASAEQQ